MTHWTGDALSGMAVANEKLLLKFCNWQLMRLTNYEITLIPFNIFLNFLVVSLILFIIVIIIVLYTSRWDYHSNSLSVKVLLLVG